jgi:hypothetical protein
MSTAQRKEGKVWIEVRLLEFARVADVPLEIEGWDDADGDVRHDRLTLAVRAAGSRRLLPFTNEDLEDIPGDSAARDRVGRRLDAFVREADEAINAEYRQQIG